MLSSLASAQYSRSPSELGTTARRPTGSSWRPGPKRASKGRWERGKGMRVLVRGGGMRGGGVPDKESGQL